jgi:hypothetical protein
MDVFVVPVAPGRHELYCEMDDEPVAADARREGFAARLVRRFHQTMADAEHARERPAGADHGGWTRRFGRWILGHVAEAVAEQRLLWHLRRQADATLVYPDELAETAARDLLRRTLARDRDRHRFWLVVDAALAAITGPLFFFVPGPNLVAYYFVFRAVGHLFAWRGARRGLGAVRWGAAGSAELTALGAALGLPSGERAVRVRALADRLRLQHHAAFVDKVAPA